MIKNLVHRLVEFGERSPLLVMSVALALMAASWGYASKLDLLFFLPPRLHPLARAARSHHWSRVATLLRRGSAS